MRLVSKLTLSATVALGGLALASSSAFAAGLGNVYLGDYAGKQFVTFDLTGAPLVVTPTGVGAEGIGGTNSRLAVALSNGKINVYDTTGSSPVFDHSFNSVNNAFRLAFDQSATNLYAAEGGHLRQFDFATSTLISTITLSGQAGYNGGAWGIAADPGTGKILFTTNWFKDGNASHKFNGGVYEADFVNHTYTTIVAPKANDIEGEVGITFNKSGKDLYVVIGGNRGGGSQNNGYNHVDHYSWNGSTATYLERIDTADGDPDTNGGYNYAADPLKNAFDTEVGPDGNLYVTSQAGACAVKFDLDANGDYLGANSIFIGAHAGGLKQAKTIHFTSNNVPGAVPEPGAVAFGILAGGSLLGLIARRRKA